MHESSIHAIVVWYGANFRQLHGFKIADLGAYNINGSVKDFLPEEIVGFDICEGPGVDVVIEPGTIPPPHYHAYDAVVSANAFHLSGEPEKYRAEVVALLRMHGLFCLTMCKPDCVCDHSTSPNKYGYKDGIRMTEKQLRAFWEEALIVDTVYEKGHDLVLWGRRE
jgi:hypothetical protein